MAEREPTRYESVECANLNNKHIVEVRANFEREVGSPGLKAQLVTRKGLVVQVKCPLYDPTASIEYRCSYTGGECIQQ
jgi:hypothetical protein